MTREELKNLGLTDEQVEAVMKSHGTDIERFKAIEEENNGLKAQTKAFEEQISKLTEATKGNEEMTAQIASLNAELEKQKSDYQANITKMKIDSAVDSFLMEHKARNAVVVKPLIDMTKVSVGEDGKVVGLNEQWEKIYTGNEYLFESGTAPSNAGTDITESNVSASDRFAGFEKII